MLESAWDGTIGGRSESRAPGRRSSSRRSRQPGLEVLEGRLVMTASLAALPAISVPSSQGYEVSLDGSGSANPQTFSVTSSNPDVKAAVATGDFWTINVTHTAASGHPGDVSFSGTITFQLFSDLTPTTYNLWQTFTTDGYFVGKDLTRIVTNFGGNAGHYVIQGGAPNPDGSGNSGQPGTPYGLELSQQLGFTGPGTSPSPTPASPTPTTPSSSSTRGPRPNWS